MIPVVLAVMALTFAAGYALAVFVIFPAPEVQGAGVPVPDLVGLQVARAEQAVREAGLARLEVTDLPHPTEPRGTVTAQSPLAGQQLRAGASVRVAVSSGPPRVMVPDVTGFSEDRASELLARLGFDVARETEEALADSGRVIRVNPSPGTRHELPARITIVVSTGPAVADTMTAIDTLRADTLPRIQMLRPRRDTLLAELPRAGGEYRRSGSFARADAFRSFGS
jgi:serine/threonine-protein kinase